MVMKASSTFEKAITVLHYSLFALVFVVGIYYYQRLEAMEKLVQMPQFPWEPVQGPYQEALKLKVQAIRTELILLAGVFLTEKRFLLALSWLKDRPNLKDRLSLMRFATGALVLIFLLLYIGILVKMELVVRSLGL